MPQFVFTSPDGKKYVINGPEGSTPDQAWGYLQQQIGTQEQPKETPGVISQILGAPKEVAKGFIRGLTVDPLSGASSLAYTGARAAGADLTPFEQTGFGKGLSAAQTYLAPSDEGLITQFGSGLGSLASFIPGSLLKGGIRLATTFTQAGAVGSEEARARAEQARLSGEADATAGEQFLSQVGGTGIGFTELLPIERLASPIRQILRGVPVSEADKIAPGLFNAAQRMLVTGGIEGFQEGMANIGQDLIAKGIYNPNLDVGESALGDAAMGASIGAFAQGAIELATRGKRNALYEQLKGQELQKEEDAKNAALRAEELKNIEQAKQNLGISDNGILALPAPAPQIQAVGERDPLMNPVGFLNANELTPEYLKSVNNIRDGEGKAKLQQFSIEDLADAGAPQGEIDRLLTYKTGFSGEEKLSPQDILNIAVEKNVDTSTVGFNDFLRRATGSYDLRKMSQPQLYSAFKALGELDASESLRILPEGTNATRFTQEQYDKSLSNLSALFPTTNLLGRSSVLQEIKDYSGLESDRDAESLLQTAIRKGDLDTVSKSKYDLVDSSGKVVRTYLTRESAERAAAKEGLSVRESTSINIALPGTAAELPGGPDIRKGTFQEGVEPAGYEVRSPDAILTTSNSQEEAEAKADRLAALRQQKALGFLGQIQKVENEIAKSQAKLESMEADGKADTLAYKQMSAKIAANNKNLEAQINRLRAKAESFAQPLEIAPKGEKPVTRDGFTLFEQGKPVATFPNQQAAEQEALTRLNDEILQKIASLGRFQKGLMPKRLAAMAREEMDRRAGKVPAGIGIKITGTRAEAEAKLAEAGIFTGEFKAKAEELSKKLRPIMDRLGLKDLRLNLEKAIMSPMGEADGYYAQKLIAISMTSPNPIRTLKHEGIHALKELGAFTPDQWRVLENRARTEWMGKYDIANRYKGLDQESQLEEAISDAFSDFDQTKPPAGMIGALFRKIKQFFEALGNGIRGMGFQSVEGIFSDVDAGLITPDVSLVKEPVSPVDRIKYQLDRTPRVMGTGKIVGAPPGMSTESDRKKLITKMTKLLDHPFTMFEESKDWYENSGATVREISRENPELMERVVRLLSLYSQANSLGGNTTATIKSIAQLAQGQPTALAGRFPNETAARIPAILSAPTMDSSLPGVEDKLMNFYRNLRDATFKQDTFADASTVDRWMMRLFGYPHAEDQEVGGSTGVSNTQYTYAKDLIKRIADAETAKTGEVILPRQIQAALWTYVRNQTDYESLSAEKKKNFEPTNIDFADYVTRATANISWESRPSTSLPLIPGIHKASRKAQEEFNKAVRSIFVDENGNDKIFELLGNQQLYSSEFSSGAYENMIAPNVITKLVLQKDDGEYLTSVADNYAAIVGYVTKQDAVPWYRADPKATGKDASKGYRVRFKTELTPELEDKLFKHLNEKIPGVGFTNVGNALDFINFRDVTTGKPYMMSDKEYFKKLDDALRTFAPDVELFTEEFRAKSGWISNDWKENPNGEGYTSRLGEAGLGDLQRVIDGWSEAYNRTADNFGKEFKWSLRSDESIPRPSIGGGVSIREQQPNAQSFDAVHYGKQRVNSLAGSLYGTGIKGAEAPRVFASPDPRVRQRAYFYVPYPGGRMPMPESGLGNEVHVQRLNNLLGPGDDMQALVEATRSPDGKFDPNAFESAVIDAGFDGYAVPDMGMAVVLGADVPVISRGTRQEVAARPAEDSVQIGDRRYSLRQVNTPEFKQWFDDSSIVKDDGAPKMMYHGTSRDITKFRPKQASAIFLTDSPRFAESFSVSSEDYMIREYMDSATPEQQSEIIEKAIAKGLKDKDILPSAVESLRTMPLYQAANTVGVGDYIRELVKNELPSNQNIMPLYVSAKDVFDYENPSHVRRLSYVIEMDDVMIEEVSDGDWGTIESEDVQEAIRELFADGFYVKEGGKKNLAVFRPEQIKSAIGNIGTFSRTDKDIRYALALGNIEPSTAVVPDIGGNPNGNMGLLPTKLGSKPIRLLVGTHDDIENKGYGANHILNRVLSDPRRTPEGSEELLEKIARTAQKTAQNYNRIYQDGNKLVLFDGKNSLILSSTPSESSIVTMFIQDSPDQKYGRPVWTGRAPSLAEFVEPVRGMSVEARDGRVAPKSVAVTKKRVVTPSGVLEAAPVSKGTLGLKKMALRVSETSEFKDWFKDSKAVDESGKPLVMYHGTKYVFDEFKISKDGGSLGSGIYLTPSTGFASDYAVEENANVIPLYASIQNPLIIDGSISRDPMIEAFVKLGVDRNKAENIVEKAYEDKGYITNEVRSRATKQGFDGIFQYKDGKLSEVVAFNPTQIKSIYNQEPSVESKKFSLRAQPIDQVQTVPQGTVDVEPTGTRDNLIYLLQDKQIDLKRVIEGLRKAGRDIAERWDAYLKEELFHGRSATRIKFFVDRELQPLLKKMEAANISLEQMDDYLLARHAKEANDYIRSINPDPNANAGMTDKDAADYLKALPPPRRAALERIANDVYAMTKGTRELMVGYGLENRKTIDTWEKQYQNYVPLFREEIEGDEANNSYVPISIGRGYNIRGGTTKRRTGSSLKVADVLANIAMQRERVIVRGEKNRVGNALYGLVAGNPNKGLWGVINPEKTNKQVMRNELLELGIDPSMVDEMIARPITKSMKNGMVTYQVPSLWKSAENIFITRVNGEDRFIGFNKKDERAMRMASTLKNLDAQQQGEAIRMMGTAGDYYRKTLESVGKGTRFFASVNTQYNPAFGIYNLMRDIGGAALNLQSTPLKGQESKVIADSFVALKAIYRDLRRQRDGLAADSKWAEIFEEFELEGGKTGYRDMFEDTQSRAEALQKELTDFQKGNLKGKGKAVMNWLSDFNDAIENSVRVSVYKNAIDKGLSKERAASLAKNITVNFNRTGAVSRNFQTLFAFFNASVQGTARIAQTLLTSEGKLSPAGKKIVMGGITLGLAQSVLLAMAGLDDDEVPDFVKDKAFIIPTGDGKYLAIPMPLGYNIIPGFGRRVMEFAMSDDKNVGKSVFNTSQMLLDGFNPLGSATFVQMLTPTILDPIVALAENKDFTGKPIAREDINSLTPTPGYTRGSQNAFAVTEGLAYAINILTGGSEFKKGAVSPTPDQIEYLVGQVFGGVGREAMKVGRGIESFATGEELATYNIPIAGRLVGNVQQKAAQTNRFYQNVRILNEHQEEIEGRINKGEDISEYIDRYPEASLYQAGDKIYSRIRKLKDIRKTMQEYGAGREDLQSIDEAMLGLMSSLNDIYASAKSR